MPQRRRYRDEGDQPHPTASFTWGNLVNLAAIPLVTGAIMLIGWYFLSSDTLKRHGEAIKEITVSREDEKRARETVRNEFMASQNKLVEVLGRLDTRLSVSEKQQEAAGRQIEKISDFLQSNTSRKVPVR